MQVLLYRLIFALNPLWAKLGANVQQLRMILEVKQRMAERTPIMAFNKSKKENYDTHASTGKKIWANIVPLLLGASFCMYFLVNPDFPQTALFYNAGALMMMASVMMIVDYSSVLLNTDDYTILSPRPVNAATILLSRTLFFLVRFVSYNLLMTVATVLVLCFVASIWQALLVGLLYMVLFLLVFCMVQFVLFLTLKIVPAQFFTRIIPWLQGLILILVYFTIYGGDKLEVFQGDIFHRLGQSPFRWVLPNYWLSAIAFQKAEIGFYLLLLGLPLAMLLITIRYLSAGFFTQVASTEQSALPKKKSFIKRRSRTWVFRKQIQKQAFYLFTKRFISRDNAFKMAVLPNMIYIVFINFRTFLDIWNYAMGHSSSIKSGSLIMPYYLFMYPITFAFLSLPYSKDFKASWAMHVAPVMQKGIAFQGMFLAVLRQYFVPLIVCYTALCLFLKPAFWANALLAIVTTFFFCLLNAYLFFNALVASEEHPQKSGGLGSKSKQRKTVVRMLFFIFVAVILGMLHIFLVADLFWWGILTIAFVLFGASVLLWYKLGEKK